MWKRFSNLGLLLIILALLTACAVPATPTPAAEQPSGEQEVAVQEEAAPQETPRMALIIAQGGLGDRSYNDLGYEGLQRSDQEFDVEAKAIESADPVGEGEQLLRTAADSGFGLVITLEYTHFDPLDRVAPDYPDTLFSILNIVVDQPNVASVLFKEHQGSFLAGALAAMVTQMPDNPKVNPEKIIGVIGGTKSAGIDKFLVGYEEGAHYIDPDVKVLRAYSDSFGDPAKGKELALSMYEQGADIVYQVAGGTGEGVFEAAEEANHYAIGVDADQDYIKPGHILTSMMKRTDNAVYDVTKKFTDGSLEGGTVLEYGLKENGVGLSPMEYTKDEIPQEYLDRVAEIRDKIESGDIQVTDVTKEQ